MIKMSKAEIRATPVANAVWCVKVGIRGGKLHWFLTPDSGLNRLRIRAAQFNGAEGLKRANRLAMSLERENSEVVAQVRLFGRIQGATDAEKT